MIGRLQRMCARARSESGGIFVITAVSLVALIGMAALVLDVGHWWEHKRHLQLEADAAAFAGGQMWQFPCSAATDTAIVTQARNYAGDHLQANGAAWIVPPQLKGNNQIANTPLSSLHMMVNASTWYDPDGPAVTDFSDGGGSGPCAANHLDVKLTDQKVSVFFGLIRPDVKAKARVEIQGVQTLSGLRPVGVRSSIPKSGAVIFIDEANNNQIITNSAQYLTKGSSAGGLTTWSSFTNQSTFTMPSRRVGAVVAFSGNPKCPLPVGQPGPCFSLNTMTYPTISQLCNQGDVECNYATQDSASGVWTVQSGLLFVQGYDNVASSLQTAPVLHEAYLTPQGQGPTPACADEYFNIMAASCKVKITALVDITGRSKNDVEINAFDSAGECPTNGCSLSFQSPSGPWSTGNGALIEVDAERGPESIRLDWSVKSGEVAGVPCTASTPCTGSFGQVQRTFAGSDETTGAIRSAVLFRGNGTSLGITNTAVVGQSVTYYVSVNLAGAVASTQTDPPIALRVTGSQNGTIDCDPNVAQFVDEFSSGCAPNYTRNPLTTSPLCPAYNQLWNTAQPWSCVKTQTGGAVGNLDKALKLKLFGDQNANKCTTDSASGFVPGRNYWHYPSPNLYTGNSTFPHYGQNDPRLVQLFLVPFGTFLDNGNGVFPVIGFGMFYITGWGDVDSGGNKQKDLCPGADSAPKGYITGHFVSEFVPSGSGTGTGQACIVGGLEPCIAVLTE